MGTQKVKKRNGAIEDFSHTKITLAISKAMDAVGQFSLPAAEKVSLDVVKEVTDTFYSKKKTPTVEQVQDLVEKHLVLHRLPEVAKAYILYRDLHTRMRSIQNLFDAGSWIESYINKTTWKVHSDSEIDFHLQAMYKKIAEEISERYWMNEVYTEEMRDLHNNKDLHIHKSSAISAYCVGWDLYHLLKVGYGGVAANVVSCPPKHLDSALGQLMNFMYVLTNETPDGAIAISNLDTLLAPFIRYDGLDYEQTRHAIQSFVYNMNVPSKAGGQVVFSNISLDLICPKHLADEPVICGGKSQRDTYKEFQKEMDMFNRALTEIYTGGDANGRAFSWPIPTYNLTKDFNWDNENLNGLWEMTAKYGVPYFANFINSDMDPSDVRSMCCRLRIDNRVLHRRGGALFGANPLTGSIGYTTINLPRIGYLANGDKGKYFERLEYLMDKSREILTLRRKLVEDLTERGLYPYSKFYLQSVRERTGKWWTNHFSTIGIVGMNESCINMFGTDITTPEGQEFAKSVLDFMNKRMLTYQEESDELYNLEASPAESATYIIAKKDKELYPDIIVANEKECEAGAEPYYTNSTHLPVGFTDDVFEALDLQDELQAKYTGGTVFHAFLGERLTSGEEAKQLVRKIAEKYSLPYFTLSPTFSICETHGYLKGSKPICPRCKKECKVYSRVVGKISPTARWNPGKRAEFKDRKTYKP